MALGQGLSKMRNWNRIGSSETQPHIYDHLSCDLGGTGGRAFFSKNGTR